MQLQPVLLDPAKRKHLLAIAITLILSGYQLIRIIAFVNVYGGVEHDSGWALTVSRSLAGQGAYTTTVSTIVDPRLPGGLNIDQKFDIQAPDGRIWFRTGNNIGPASIVLDALALKILGTGFWALRAGPLLFYTLFLLLAAYLLYQLAGLGAIVLFNLFLFFYPHLSIFLSYEALGEMPAMVFVLGAYLACAAAIQKKERRRFHFVLAGLIAGLAVNTKLVAAWSIGGILVWAGMLWLVGWIGHKAPGGVPGPAGSGKNLWWPLKFGTRSGQPELYGGEVVLLGGGLVLVLALWELIQLVILTRLTGFSLYLRHAQQRFDVILNEGSGVGERIHSGPEFFWDKFFQLEEIAQPQRWLTAIIFAAIFLGGLALLWRWHARPRQRNLLAPLWLGWLANTAWFAGLAKTGWPRHFWFGLVLGAMLLCIISAALVRPTRRGEGEAKRGREEEVKTGGREKTSPRRLSLAVGLLLLALLAWDFASQPHVWGFFLPDEIVPYWQQKQINHKYGASLPWIIIPRAAQADIVAYLRQLPPEANVYYPAQHKAAEISALAGRIFYPLERRQWMRPSPQDVGIIGPSLIAPWMDPVRRETLRAMVRAECPRPLLANDYYMLCPFPATVGLIDPSIYRKNAPQ